MAQGDIMNFMYKNPEKWHRSQDLSKALGLSRTTVTTQLRYLYKASFVEHKKVKKGIYYEHFYRPKSWKDDNAPRS